MRIEKIGAEYKRKFNLGSYESAEIAAMLWAATDEGDDVGECYDTLFAIAKETVKINLPPTYKANNPNYSESFTKYGAKVAKEELEAYEVPY
jgi:hypothetical protein